MISTELPMKDFKLSKNAIAWESGLTKRISFDNNQSTTMFCTVGHQTQNDTTKQTEVGDALTPIAICDYGIKAKSRSRHSVTVMSLLWP